MIHITPEENGFVVEEISKSSRRQHFIPKDRVFMLERRISTKLDRGINYGYRYIVKIIIRLFQFPEVEVMGEKFFIEAFNGGKFRAKYYFPYYYYPLKILEARGLIDYYGKAGVRLK